MEFTFEEWWLIYCDTLKELGWTGRIDEDSAINDYNDGLSPEAAAKSIYDELKD